MEKKSAEERFPVLEHFGYEHLPEPLRRASRPFYELAHAYAEHAAQVEGTPGLVQTVGQETAAGLRKLLEAKDCHVRAVRIANAMGFPFGNG